MSLAGVKFEGNVQSVAKYANAISGLSLVQQKAVLSASGLSEAQIASALAMGNAAIAAEGLSVEEAAAAAGMKATDLAMALKIKTTDQLTASTLLAAVAEGRLNQEEYESIVAINASTAATTAQGVAATTLSTKLGALAASMKATFTAFLTTPAGIITLISVLLPLVIKLFDEIIVTAEEANEAMDKSFSEFEEATSKVESLNSELETTQNRIRELEAKGSLTFVEQSELDKLRETNKLLQIQADLAEKERSREAKEAAGDTVTAYRKNFSHEITSDKVQDNIDYFNFKGNNAVSLPDETDISAMLAYIEQTKKLRDELDKSSEYYVEDYQDYSESIDSATDSIWEQVSALQGYADKLEAIPENELLPDQAEALEEINNAVALIYNMLDPAKWRDIQFSGLTDGVKDELNRMSSEGEMTADQVERLSKRFPELNTVMEQTGMDAQDVADYFNALAAAQENGGTSAEGYTAKLSNLSETISGMKSAYDLLETAQEEMNTAGGLSADTIAKLASSCDNYMDFLYEENGLIKLNTEAWRENAEAKIRSDMTAIQQEIAALEGQNRILQEQIGGADSSTLPGQAMLDSYNTQMRDNMALIQEHQNQLSMYEGVFNTIRSSADSAFQSVTESLNALMSRYDAVTAAQEEFNESGILSASTLTSIASAYPALQASIDAYIAGMISAKDLLAQLSGAYEADVGNYNAAIQAKIASGVGFQNTMTENQSILVDALTDAYQTDLSNFQAVEEKKLAFQAQIIEKLAQNYSKYANASLAGMKAELDHLYNIAGDPAEIAALSDAINKIDVYNRQIEKIASGEGLFRSFDPGKFKAQTTGGSSGGGGSGSSSGAKAEAKGWLDMLNDLDGNVNSLSGALKELNEEGSVSTKTLSGLSGAFGKLSSFNSAINAMGKSGATMGEAQEACNALAEELIRTSGILDMVTDENAEVIASALEAMGVTNARALVLRKFNSTSAATVVAENGLSDAAWEQVDAFLRSAGVTQEEISALQALRAEQYNASLAAVDFTKANAGVTEELIRQAKAAGASSDALAALRKLQTYQTMGYAGAKANGFQGTEEAFNHFLNTLAEQARIDLSDVEIAAPDVEVNVTVEGEESSQFKVSDGTSLADRQKQLAKDMGIEAPTLAVEEDLERYVVEIEKFRDAIHQLTEAIKDQTRTQQDLDMTDDLREKIELERKLIQDTKNVQADRHALNTERRAELDKSIAALKELGFDIDHDLENNKLYVKNLGMINKLSLPEINRILSETGGTPVTNSSIQRIEAENNRIKETEDLIDKLEKKLQDFRDQFGDKDGNIDPSSGAYEPYMEVMRELSNAKYVLLGSENNISWSEATSEYVKAENSLREFIEKTIDDMNEFNDANQENSEAWLDDAKTIREAQKSIIDLLGEIVSESSKSVDKIQDVYSTLKQGAKEFAEYEGSLTIDTFQKIVDLGPQYMQYLVEENGQWVINEERIKAVTAAKAEQLALDNAWTYVERLKMALEEDSIENLNELLYATTEAAEGTWDLVYANLAMLNLDGEQYEAALHNIQVMRDLAYAAIDGIGIVSDATSDSVGNMREGLDDILHYVMDMLKQKVQDQIDALGDMKDAYSELIDEKKKSLDATKTEESYGKKRAKQLKEIAKLQARIDMLSLDDSREAQAERTKLLEQMADLQENLSDTQSDYAIDNQKDTLDKMKDAYEDEKDAEIKKLEDSVSSQQKLYEKAIDYIQTYWGDRWDELKVELLEWNYDVGSDLEENLVSAWENATAAAQKYGDFVSAMEAVKVSESSSDYGNVVANRTGYSDEVNRKVIQMKQNSLAHLTADSGTQKELEKKNLGLSKEVSGLIGTSVTMSNGYWMANGSRLYDFTANELLAAMKKNSSQWMNATGDRRKELEKTNSYIASMIDDRISDELYLDQNGVWWLKNAKKKLYEVGSLSSFHTGGTVGWNATLRDNEVLAKLQTGETVLTRKMWENAVEMVNNITKMTEAMSGAGMRSDWLSWSILRDIDGIRPNTVINITNDTRPVEINFGDTIINGAAPDAVERHREISREMMNEIARRIRKP